MKLKIACLLTTGLVTVMGTSPVYAVVVPADPVTPLTINTAAQDISTLTNPNASLVNFDDVTPNPTMFFQAPPETITSTPATFTGGTVLGLATFFPAIVFASGQNVYGTADFGNTHSSTLSMSINSPLSNITHEVSFALFNGETFNQSYTVTTNFTDGTFATNSFSQIAPNWQSGYALVDLLFPALDISSIAINATNSGVSITSGPFDFLIDSVAFNQSLSNVIISTPPDQPPPPPKPPQIETQPVDVVHYFDSKGREIECRGKACDLPIDNSTVLTFQLDCSKGLCKQSDQAFALTVPAVPEPETYAMLLAGFGVMGFIARRRRA